MIRCSPRFTLRHYEAHYVLDGLDPEGPDPRPHPKLPANARLFWNSAILDRCDGGVVMWRKGRVIGFCRYCLDLITQELEKTDILAMAGTWVTPRYRHKGFAIKMWQVVFQQLRSGTRILAVTVSRNGDRLVNKLCVMHPYLVFNIEQGCRCPELDM